MKNQYCERCNNKTRSIRKNREGRYVCWDCYIKEYTIIKTGKNRKPVSFEEAISRIYEVRGRKQKTKNNFSGWCYFPKILVGHKFKIEVIK